MIEQQESEDENEDQKILFKAAIDTLNCHSCGVCQSLCPSGATQLNFLTNDQMWSQISANRDTGRNDRDDRGSSLLFHDRLRAIRGREDHAFDAHFRCRGRDRGVS